MMLSFGAQLSLWNDLSIDPSIFCLQFTIAIWGGGGGGSFVSLNWIRIKFQITDLRLNQEVSCFHH